MTSSFVRPALLTTTLGLVVLSGCQCLDDTGFNFLPDAGVDAGPPPPPPPPVFPLKADDIVVFNGVGGRVEPCDIEGRCERTLVATFEIGDVTLDPNINRWTVEADFTYEMTVGYIASGAISQLFLSRAAPFADLEEGGAESGTADFNADGAPTDALVANDFPFFHFESAYATREDSAYRTAAAAFQERILELDPEAELENQAADAKLEAYFKDPLGANPMLHKVRVELHPFGFICGWDERLIPWSEGMPRAEGAFSQASGIPLAAVFPGQVRLDRDGESYNCSCFTKQCRQRSNQSVCLDPEDPDAEPLPCECLGESPPETCP